MKTKQGRTIYKVKTIDPDLTLSKQEVIDRLDVKLTAQEQELNTAYEIIEEMLTEREELEQKILLSDSLVTLDNFIVKNRKEDWDVRW